MRCVLLVLGVQLTAAAETAPPVLPIQVYCAPGYARRVPLRPGFAVPQGATVRTIPADLLSATLTLAGAAPELRLSARGPGHGTLTLLDPSGAVLAESRVQVVTFSTNASRAIGSDGKLHDGSTTYGGELVVLPYVRGIDVRVFTLANGVTTHGGLPDLWIASETFRPTPSTGGAIVSFHLVLAPEGKYTPFAWVAYQDGEQISP
ncbi:hypothetical protein LBMAG53_09890 [Planctomycetota bacterium]|nr:hypothetical protein LBMAG53_09890 [Planctomycetota bacterium]